MSLIYSSILQNKPFDVYIETLNSDTGKSDCWVGLALMDCENNVKEIITTFQLPNSSLDGKITITQGGFNGHLGYKIKIINNIITQSISDTDKLQLMTQNSIGDWIKVLGVGCESFVFPNNNNPEVSSIKYDINVPSNLFHDKNCLITQGFKGESVGFFMDKTFNSNGEPLIHYITIDDKIVYRDYWDHIYCEFKLSKDEHFIKIQQFDRNELQYVEITTNAGNEVRSKIIDIPLDRIGHLKIIGKVNSNDLYWIYNYLPVLEYLDLSEAETTEPINFDNLNDDLGPLSYYLPDGQHGQLKTLKLPSNTKMLPRVIFAYFEPLQNNYVPKSVEYIGEYAFQGANTLRHLIFENPEPCEVDPSAFNSDFYYENITLHVPVGSKENYRKHPELGRFINIIEDENPIIVDFWDETIHYIGTDRGISVDQCTYDSYGFDNLVILDETEIDGIHIPVIHINAYAFKHRPIKTLSLNKNIAKLEKQSFCHAVIDCLDLGDNVQSIEDEAFFNSNIAKIRIGKNIKYISDKAFNNTLVNPEFIYWCCPNKTSFNLCDPNRGKCTMVSPYLTPTFESSFPLHIWIPGATYENYIGLENCNLVEMWEYVLDKTHGRIKIAPSIDGIAINKVTINGKELTPAENTIYEYNPSATEPEVIVDFNLHNRQNMTTVYNPEFNAVMADTSLINAIDEIQIDSNVPVDVYDITGNMIKHRCNITDVNNLPSGVYILKYGASVSKHIIK